MYISDNNIYFYLPLFSLILFSFLIFLFSSYNRLYANVLLCIIIFVPLSLLAMVHFDFSLRTSLLANEITEINLLLLLLAITCHSFVQYCTLYFFFLLFFRQTFLKAIKRALGFHAKSTRMKNAKDRGATSTMSAKLVSAKSRKKSGERDCSQLHTRTLGRCARFWRIIAL